MALAVRLLVVPSMRLLLLASFLFAGCGAQISSTQVNQPPAPMFRRPVESVELFTSGPPTRPHTDVALLEAEPGFTERSTGELIERLREKAAAQGCDGLVVTGVDTQLIHGAGDRKTVTGTCIVYAPTAVANP